MSIVLIRSLILYIVIIFSVRLMGKRQLGELQPSELVITILVSNIATLTLEDTSTPLIVGITPILALVCFEVIMSWLTLKYPRFRCIVSGHAKILISNGKIDQNVMKTLRLTVDDLMTALRLNGIFAIDDVQYAVVETTGNISVMKKDNNDGNKNPQQIVISDGKLLDEALIELSLDKQWLYKTILSENKKIENIFIMTLDSDKNYCIIDKE